MAGVVAQDVKEKSIVCSHILTHVKNKRHFDGMVEEANKRRALEQSRGTHWYDRVAVVVPAANGQDESYDSE